MECGEGRGGVWGGVGMVWSGVECGVGKVVWVGSGVRWGGCGVGKRERGT